MFASLKGRFLLAASLFFICPLVMAHDLVILNQEDIDKGYQHVDTHAVPFQLVDVPELNAQIPVKPMLNDPETGMTVDKLIYEAGFTNTWHTHNCAHGFYVLDGILNTHKGDFGPGEFIWFPEGELMFHGATEDNAVTALFITNKPFDIHYPQTEQKAE